MIAIFTVQSDFHALVIHQELKKRDVKSCLIEIDKLWEGNKINIDFWSSSFQILDNEKTVIDISGINLIWWRRNSRGQNYENSDFIDDHKGYINNEFEASLFGLLHSAFQGKWISHPFATLKASNKIVQTKLALQVGFNVPKTLFSQDFGHIEKSINAFSGEMVLKPVYGTTTLPVFTKKIDTSILEKEQDIGVCPSIFQEFIPGDAHLRINVFGKDMYSFLITTKELDWRQNITDPVSIYEPEDDLKEKILKLLDLLDLQMGIFDFKIHSLTGACYFFEVNPQGNFLFLQGITKFPLEEKFADFLISNCNTNNITSGNSL